MLTALPIAATRVSAGAPDWAEVPLGPFPFIPAVPNNPVLTPVDVTDAAAEGVADPFLFYEGGRWYLFFEVESPEPSYGKIAVATSPDGFSWTYRQVVLDEGWHHSYPYILKNSGKYYMIPESAQVNEVRIYEATDFPYVWSYKTTLVSGRYFVDPSVFLYNGTWWMLVGGPDKAYCYLYYSEDLLGPWTEHPMSPIVDNDKSKARPGGRALVFAQGRVLRMAQKSDITYGEAVRVFEVDTLSRSRYAEHEIPESPVLQASGSGWNGLGMHTCDPWWVGDRWVASVDGTSEQGWCIGLYWTPIAVDSPAFAGDARGRGGRADLRLTISQRDPLDSGVTLRYEIPAPGSFEPRVWILDPTGRLVRTLTDPSKLPGTHVLVWDGSDSNGGAVPAGVYFCRLQAGDVRGTGRVVWIR